LRSWKVRDDSVLLVVREEIARVWVVGEVEEGVDAAEDGGDAFAGRRWDRTLVLEVTLWIWGLKTNMMNIHLQPARPASPFMKLMPYASNPLIVPENIPQA
jgi:hypothetical protein